MAINSTSSLAELVPELRAAPPAGDPEPAASGARCEDGGGSAAAGCGDLFSLHYVHLTADFPDHSPWMDWAKYTDEGWYGDAAIRHYQLGHWNVPGDFNPAAALPVWPALELVLFRFTGVSLAAARALSVTVFGLVSGLLLLACPALLEQSRQRWSE